MNDTTMRAAWLEVGIAWFTSQVLAERLPLQQMEEMRRALTDQALLGLRADRQRQLLRLVMVGDVAGAQDLARVWIRDAAAAHADLQLAKADDNEAPA